MLQSLCQQESNLTPNEETMLRSFLIYMSKAAWAQRMVTGWSFAWKAASRFVAGSTVQDAIKAVRDLNAKGINATLDHLGEHTSTAEEADQSVKDVLEIIEQVSCCEVRSNVSIKLTQLGLALDENLCSRNLERILECAKKYHNYVRIDMEDTPYTDVTIRLYRQMRHKGFNNVGMVVQSYLYRTEADTKALLAEDTRFRLVKGAYKEPPNLAFPKKANVDANFDLLTKLMIDEAIKLGAPVLSKDGRIPPIPALGTHDEKRILFGKKYAERVGLPKQAIEIQMLYGIRRDIQDQLASEGYPVRVYVPYGTHWYPYFVRRLAERPANLWFFISNYFRK